VLIQALTYIFYSDIDECVTTTDNCDTNADCSNNAGSFSCSCNVGYFGDGETCQGMLKVITLLRKTILLKKNFRLITALSLLTLSLENKFFRQPNIID